MSTNRVKGSVMDKSTAVICSECGKGNFKQGGVTVIVRGGMAHVFTCTVCGTAVTSVDFEGNQSEGESLIVVNDILMVVTEDES